MSGRRARGQKRNYGQQQEKLIVVVNTVSGISSRLLIVPREIFSASYGSEDGENAQKYYLLELVDKVTSLNLNSIAFTNQERGRSIEMLIWACDLHHNDPGKLHTRTTVLVRYKQGRRNP